MRTETVYFEEGGRQHTQETLQLARSRAAALGVRDIVVASSSGVTGVEAARVFSGLNVVVVASVVGFGKPNEVALLEEHRRAIEGLGGKVLVTGHAFGMLGRAVNKRFGAIQVDEVIAHVLRLLSQGVKVGCEIACMAADAGLIKSGEETIALGGTGQGVDSAVVLRASNTHAFFDTRILEIICKPRE